MKAYATVVNDFSETVSEADQANVIAVASSLSEFAKTLPENSFWENLFGISDLGTFSSDIEYFGEGLKTYATSVSNIGKLLSDDDVSDLSATISSLGNMIQNLGENTNTYTDLWTISGALGDFGTQYAYFVQKLNESGVSTHQESALTLVQEIAEIIVSLADIRSVYDISDYIKWIADDLATFATKTKDLDSEGIVKIGTFIRNITESALLANDIGDTSLTAVQELLNSFSELTIPEFNLEGEAAAIAYISSLVLGIQNGVTSISNAAIAASNQGVAAIRLTYTGWSNAGNYLGIGLGSGITSATGFIRTAAVNAARSAISAVRVTWDEHSPSKVGAELGQFWDMGLAGGIDRYGYLIGQSAADVSSDAIRSAQSVLNDMSHIGSDIDSNFTIRPVMDLTDILNGMNDIDGLFSGERTIASGYFNGLTGIRSARAFASEQGRITAMTDNGDIVNELVMLEKKLDELSESVRNMKIVLDTGVVVGEITEGVDENLGVLAGRRERGN